ncbi:MAG: hypothetical protein Q9162_001754 [Coniocarpon cinnabarinum]
MATASAALDFVDFLNASPTPFHAVRSVKQRLAAAGFKLIKERDSWSTSIKPGGKYYVTRNASSIVAFTVGQRWRPGNPISMIGAHTDSPCLKVKPYSRKQSEGFLQVGVECYGGGLWHTWFDRDLSLAGRAMVRQGGSIEQKLVHITRPILRIPTLAVHLDRQENFSFNKETQLFPIAGLVAAELDRQGGVEKQLEETSISDGTKAPLKAMTERHHPFIVELVAKEAGVAPEDVVDFELSLYDTQKACLGGLNEELIFSARLDNLGMTYCGTTGLINSSASGSSLKNENTIRLLSCFDHEEVGSLSAQGADSNLLPAVLHRLCSLPASAFEQTDSDDSYERVSHGDDVATAFEQTLATSFLLSADMAHSVNPNYVGKYESDAKCEMNKGPVIKCNANQRYSTNSPGITLLQEAASKAPGGVVPLQMFVVRNDSSCGSTIGPMLAGKLGSRTLDLGNPQMSMHSIRECGGAYDVGHATRLFESFYEHYGELEKTIVVD